MGAALSLFVLLSISVFVVRVAAVALRLTGLPNSVARFQALSAFSGTGFTTSEAEVIVNYPLRRRIVGLLMVVGNLGLVSVLAALVVSFVNTKGEMGAVAEQFGWLLGVLGLLWFLILNPIADRIMCGLIGRALGSWTFLGRRHYQKLTQIGQDYSVCEHEAPTLLMENAGDAAEAGLARLGLRALARRAPGGQMTFTGLLATPLDADGTVVLFGLDAGHDALWQAEPGATGWTKDQPLP